ncbi:MAG TPA: ATP-binding protein [Candidatus Thermoplasmatota archaeon]|nr:ATP-binding protein [Candidatus Thermoplasmatota archaeon]
MADDVRSAGRVPRLRRSLFGVPVSGLVVTILLVAALEIVSRFVTGEHVGGIVAVLLLAVAFSAFAGERLGGLVSAGLVILYMLVSLSFRPGLDHLDEADMQRLLVTIATAPTMAVLVGGQRRRVRVLEEERAREERERALQREARLAEVTALKSQLETILEAAGEGIYGLDAQNRVTFANRAAAQLLGCAPSDLVGHPLEAVAGEGATGPLNGPVTYRRADGSTFPAEVTAAQIERDGERVGCVVVFRDITERVRLTNLVTAKAAELERSNADLQQFAYVASHDLQEPLRMVASYVQLIERRYRGKLDKDADEFIEYAVDGARRLQGLINDLLSYSRVGGSNAPFMEVDLGATVDTVRRQLAKTLEEKGARLVVATPLPTVRADPSQMVQILQNLVGNGLKFTAPGRAPEVSVSAERDEGAWRIAVRDNGIGIDPEYAERIFVLFQRLHSRETYPGSGIGLAICKRIVERHGGRIWVESKPGEGATFLFLLPDPSGA